MAESTEGKLNSLVALALEGFPLPEGGNAPLNTNNDTDLILCLNTETKRIDTVSKASIISGGTIPNLQNVMNQGSTAIVSTPVSVQTFENITLTSTNGDINLVGGGYGILMAEANDGIKVTGGADFKGLYYNADYSDDFVERSLVDKKYVDDAVSGGGSTPNLATVLEEGNTAPTPVIITNGTLTSTIQSGNIQAENSNYKTSVKGGLISFTDNTTEYTADIVPSDILIDGARFLLPSVTIATDHVLALMVNNTLPNDGGQIFLGLQQILDESGYAENSSGQSIDISPAGIVRLKTDGYEQTFTDDGIKLEDPNYNTLYGSSDIKVLNQINSFVTTLNYEPPTANRTITFQDGSGTVAFLSDITGGGGISEVLGTLNEITVTNGDTEPVISISSAYTSARDAVANGKVADAINDGVTTVAPSQNAVFDALEGKQSTLVSGTNIKTIEGQSLLGSGNIDLNKSDVGLSNVDNTSDINKPISTAQQSALELKAPLASPTFTGTPSAPTATAGTNTSQLATTAFVKAADDAVLAFVAANYDPIHTAAGYPYYDGVGGRTMVTGTSGAVVLANGTIQSIDLTVRGATLGTISPANTALSSGISISTFANRTQGQINNKVSLVGASDIEITDATKGVILRSPNGTRYRITVSDAGVLTTTSI